jgi:outer membrane protein TolC
VRQGRGSFLSALAALCFVASAQAQAPAAPVRPGAGGVAPSNTPPGGTAPRGAAAGGTAPGGTTPGGTAPGGAAAGGTTAGGAAAGGTAPGGSAASGAGRLEEVLGQSGGLTSQDAGRRAAETSVQAAVENEKVLSAKNDRSRVIWDALPKLTLTGQYTRLSPVGAPCFPDPTGMMGPTCLPTGPLDAYLLNAQLTVPFTEYVLRMAQALRGAGENEEAAALTERATRAGAAAGGRLAYYDWVRARLQRVLAEQALDQAKAQRERVEALHSAGRAAEADLQQARAFQADAELGVSQADTLQAIAEQRLRIAMHARPEEQLSVGENVLAPFPGAEESHNLDELYQEAQSQRLEIKAFDRGTSALDRLQGIDKTRALPHLDGFASYSYANPNPRAFPQTNQWADSWSFGLSLTWSTADLGTGITSAEATRSQREQLLQQRTLALESMRLDIASAYLALAQARVNVGTAEQGERAAGAALDARTRLAEQGLATTLELLQAQTAQVQARLNLINAHIALRVARVQLDHALGRDTPQGS